MRRLGEATSSQAQTNVSQPASQAQPCLGAFAVVLLWASSALTLVLPACSFRSASVAFPEGFASNLCEK